MGKSNSNKVEDRVSKIKVKKDTINCLSFFSGAMGLDIGLEQAGINTLLACEFDVSSRRTIVSNKSDIGLIGDIRNYSSEEILEYAGGIKKKDINLIVGGPPCQAFSTAGKRMGLNDERGNVFLKYLDIILDIKPQYAVIENVRGLYYAKFDIDLKDEISVDFDESIRQTKGSVLYYVVKKLEQGGYSVKFNLYNSADFGSPQKRERIVMICTTKSNPVPLLVPTHSENPEYGLKPWNTLKSAIYELKGTEMEGMQFPEKRLKYYRILNEGQNWTNLSEELQKEALGKAYFLGGGKTGFLRKLSWVKPSPTVVTNPTMPATDLCHPDENRPLTIEEYKAIQEFPKKWKIEGSVVNKYKQIGNAVPVGLGKTIGEVIKKHFKDENINSSIPNFKYSKYHNTRDDEFHMDFKSKTQSLQYSLEFQ